MTLFLDILFKVTLPIVALVAMGMALQPKLKLDVAGLNRLQVFVVLPCFLLHYLSSATQPISSLLPTIGFSLLQFSVLIVVGWLVALLFRMERGVRPVMALATMYANIGFFGIPVVQLAFPAEMILHQSVMTSLISIVIVTVGVWLLAPVEAGAGPFARLRQAFETPVIPAVAAGLLLRGFEITLPPVVGLPVQMMGSIFTPLALFTLGCQLADSSWGELKPGPLTLISALKLAVAPALTWGLAIAVGLRDELTDLFVVAAAAPVGVLLAVFCAEFGREARFVASAILVTTLLSPLVVTAWLLLVRMN